MRSRIWEMKGGNYEKTMDKNLVGAFISYARYQAKCFTHMYVWRHHVAWYPSGSSGTNMEAGN